MNERTEIKESSAAVLKPAPGRVIATKITAVLTRASGEVEKHETTNIVTDAGDLFYAQRATSVLPTNFNDGTAVSGVNGTFDGIMELYTDAGTPNAAPGKANTRANLTGTIATGSGQAMDSGYPAVNDGDGDNTGAGTDVVTYRVSYALGVANATDITDVIITNPSPGASEPILMHAQFSSSFTKTSSDTLKVFVNHTLAGT